MQTVTDVLAQALALHQAGQLQRAEELYRQVLAADPQHAEARHLLGVAALQAGRHGEAAAEIRRAIELNPQQSAYHNHLGIALANLGRQGEAANAFQRALRLAPNMPDVHFNLGNVLRDTGQLDQAIDSFRRAVALRPTYIEAHFNLANALRAKGELRAAVASFQQALSIKPDYFKALLNLADTLHDLGQLDPAEATCRQAVAVQPGSAKAHNNLGTVLRAKAMHDEAEACFRQALSLDPSFAEAHNNLGATLIDLKRFDEAEAELTRAMELNPNYAGAVNALGVLRRTQNDLSAAIEAFRRAVEIDPELSEAHTNLGCALQDQGSYQEAIACYRRSLEIKPDSPETHFGLASALLLLGRLAEGWPHYQWRLKAKDAKVRTMQQPHWQGEPLEGRSILLLSEQGLGDTLQFVRYAALLRQRGARVTLGCPQALVRLLSSCPYLDHVAAELGQQGFDYHAQLLSLPGILGTTLETIPKQVPYLTADASLVEQWRARLSSIEGFRVGINWQGNPKYPGDRQRSIPLSEFEPLAGVPGVRLVSLQRGYGREQIAQVAERFEVIELGDDVDQAAGAFGDTAAIMNVVELVITSDTVTPHLAGALGVPVWMATPFSPDWRWLLEREDSPWYPTMRLVRQPRLGDWRSLFERMAMELSRLTLTGSEG